MGGAASGDTGGGGSGDDTVKVAGLCCGTTAVVASDPCGGVEVRTGLAVAMTEAGGELEPVRLRRRRGEDGPPLAANGVSGTVTMLLSSYGLTPGIMTRG